MIISNWLLKIFGEHLPPSRALRSSVQNTINTKGAGVSSGGAETWLHQDGAARGKDVMAWGRGSVTCRCVQTLTAQVPPH